LGSREEIPRGIDPVEIQLGAEIEQFEQDMPFARALSWSFSAFA